MPWFKVDDGFWSHPKVLGLSDSAIALWVRAGSWCSQQLTDGFVPDSARTLLGIREMSAGVTTADELVDADLWSEEAGGWAFNDWSEYQPSKSSVEERRAADRRRKAEARAARQAKRDMSARNPDGLRTESGGSPQDVRSTRPDPTRPDPLSSNEEREKPRNRGSRVPDDFTITDDLREWAAVETPDVDIDQKTAEWVDYWRGQSGAKGVKLDWVATWRNGMRKQQSWADRDRANRKQTPTERAQQTMQIGRAPLATDLDLEEIA